MGTEQLLLTVPEARHALGGIGNTLIYDLIKAGRLEVVKLGRKTLIRASSVRALAGERADRVQRAS